MNGCDVCNTSQSPCWREQWVERDKRQCDAEPYCVALINQSNTISCFAASRKEKVSFVASSIFHQCLGSLCDEDTVSSLLHLVVHRIMCPVIACYCCSLFSSLFTRTARLCTSYHLYLSSWLRFRLVSTTYSTRNIFHNQSVRTTCHGYLFCRLLSLF